MKKITVKGSSKSGHNEEPKPTYHAGCEECGKEIAFTHDNLHVGAYGCVWTKCPHCYKRTYVRCDNEELTLTKENLVFPKHFAHFGSGDFLKVLSDEEVNELCQEAINLSRKPGFDGVGYSGVGNTIAFAFRSPSETNIYVCKNYYHTVIPEN